MRVHKNTKIYPMEKVEIFQKYYSENYNISELARAYNVSRPTIYKVIDQVRRGDYFPSRSY